MARRSFFQRHRRIDYHYLAMEITPVSRTGPRDPELPPLLAQAIAAHRAGRQEEAMALYQRFLGEDPDHPTALQLLGLLYSQRGEYESAIAYMARSLRRFREQPEVFNNMANALAACGRREEAIKSYSQAIGINARYKEAWRNLGLCLLDLNRYEDAADSLCHCIELDENDAVAWLSLGLAYKGLDRPEQAIRSLQTALSLRPDYAEAQHNLGVCLKMGGRTAEAIEHFETARRLGLDRAELYQNLGTALAHCENARGAIEAYREAVERDPLDLISHQNLNALLWEHEFLEDYLKSYEKALERVPDSVELRSDYATALTRQDRLEEAEVVLMKGLRRVPNSSELKSRLAYNLEQQDRWNDALIMHQAAVAQSEADPHHHISLARALLACQQPDRAQTYADYAVQQLPGSQLALAYQGLCWRMLDDERDTVLNDYERFVRVYDVPLPREFGDTGEFNAILARVLGTLHTGKRHPAHQTLRGGTQTTGRLFERTNPEIAALMAGLQECIGDYIQQMEDDPGHPLLSRRVSGFAFSESWSVRLRPCGYHTMHVHPMGWISSAYYVQVPPEITGTDAHGGGIKFGEPDIDLGDAGRARRTIQPTVGSLVLFPSYMWHGTVPHQTEGDRVTVAFDVVPWAGPRG